MLRVSNETGGCSGVGSGTPAGMENRHTLQIHSSSGANMSPELQAEWEALNTEFIALQQAHKALQGRSVDHAEHATHLQRLQAHMARLQGFATRLEQERRKVKAGVERG